MSTTPFNEWLRDLRQLCYPKAFRIERGSPTSLQFDTLIESLESMRDALLVTIDSQTISRSGAVDDERFMADLATRLWRIQTKMIDSTSGAPYDSVARSYQHLERLIGELEAKGIRTEDKTGETYDPGMVVTVLSQEPVQGITREIVYETVEPAVYRDGRLIQRAQIVIGTPAEKPQAAP